MKCKVERFGENRFDEQISLTMYNTETENEVGFIHGTIYYANILSEFYSQVVRRVQNNPLTDEMVRSTHEWKYASLTNRNILMLAELIANASCIFAR